ncbi:single-stranded DNA-binding protein [Mesomycoplasma lagogenitalium]|uniref:Single-stranded DNA-binding protein n=1 Tax=Mesomycoplasma lagogenitalium TaxID=171286 RepID=A0ABY8LXR2_9BACT|nr:single-stranded DNA-binding protein [Mesomycoplasma lagogenitalium]WGI36927.1 single-stranded DNA-binding protein [Mesomycoplasma lagogenitalium]
MFSINQLTITGKMVEKPKYKKIKFKDKDVENAVFCLQLLDENKTENIIEINVWGRLVKTIEKISNDDYLLINGKITSNNYKEYKNIVIIANSIQIIKNNNYKLFDTNDKSEQVNDDNNLHQISLD